MAIAITHETYILQRDGEDHLCNKRDCQELVDSDPTLIDPKGVFVNAEAQAERDRLAAEEAEEKRLAVEAEAKRLAEEKKAREDAEKAKDREIEDLKRKLAEAKKGEPEKNDPAPKEPVKRGGGRRPAPKTDAEAPKEEAAAAE